MEFVKTTVNLGEEEVAMIKELAKQRGVTMTEIIRSAIRTENLLAQEDRRGSKILVKDGKDESLKQLVFK